MDTLEINQYLKSKIGFRVEYLGIFTSDRLERLKLKTYREKASVLIANTLKESDDSQLMGHWVSFYVEKSPYDRIIFFDSFGISIELYGNGFQNFIENNEKFTLYQFNIQYQLSDSYKCGLYAIFFVHYASLFGIREVIIQLRNNFSKYNRSSNDKYVTRYFLRYIGDKSCRKWIDGEQRAITFKECRKIICMLNKRI